MTTVTVSSGACGFTVRISVEKNQDKKMVLDLDTDCMMVKKMLEDIAILDPFVPLRGFLNNPVYTSAAKHLKHVACPVPSAILKALEVEAGLNVPKDATITFGKK
jgi:hypothetical protein